MTNRGLEINNVPEDVVIGNLQELYNRYVLENKPIPTDFFNNIEKDLNDKINK